MRFFVLIVLISLLPSYSIAQEFEISLPEDYKPNRFRKQSNIKANERHKKSVSKEKISNASRLSEAELYLFNRTSDGKSEYKRVEILERVLYGKVGQGPLKNRIDQVIETIKTGKPKIHSGEIPRKIPNPKVKKWWQFGGKDKNNKDFKVLQEARRFYKKKNWKMSKDKFKQVLLIEPVNLEALLKVAVSKYEFYTKPETNLRSYLVDEKLVEAQEQLAKVKRLYTLAGDSQSALEAAKYMDKIDSFRKQNAGAVTEF